MSILKISIRQIKAARSLLGWSQDDLAEQSGVSKPTIGRLESIDSDDPIGGRPETGEALVAALQKAGVEFIPENGGGAGVRLKKRPEKVKGSVVQSALSADRADDLASKTIDRMGNATATAEEKATRKRRLLNGPTEFQKVRRDTAKKGK